MATGATKIDWGRVKRHVRNRIRNEWDVRLLFTDLIPDRFVYLEIHRGDVVLKMELSLVDRRLHDLMFNRFYSMDTKAEYIADYLVKRLLQAEILA